MTFWYWFWRGIAVAYLIAATLILFGVYKPAISTIAVVAFCAFALAVIGRD